MCARTIAGLGLLLAAFGIAQHATAPHALYWTRPFKFTEPFGPYLNRSDFAMWLVMALPLTAGYLLARLHSRQHRGGELFTADAFDNTATFLTIALGLMAAALMVGLSRSGIIGAIASALTLWTLSQERMHRTGRAWLLGGIGATALIALAYANTSAVAIRLQDTVNRGMGGRLAIWHATMPMISFRCVASIEVAVDDIDSRVMQRPYRQVFAIVPTRQRPPPRQSGQSTRVRHHPRHVRVPLLRPYDQPLSLRESSAAGHSDGRVHPG